MRRILGLASGHEDATDRPALVEQEYRWARDVPGDQSDPVPDAVGLRDGAVGVDQDVERQSDLLDVPTYGLRILREYRQDPDASSFVFRDVRGQLAELATTVGSPGAAVKCEKDGPFGEPGLERHGIALVIG